MQNLIEKSHNRDNESENNEENKRRPAIKTATDLQRLKLEKLMKNPDKPVLIPEIPKEKDYMQTVPSFVRNVMGSSAGAGSGEFHVYRHLRRKEYARQKCIHAKSMREQLDEEYQSKLEKNRLNSEAKTAKKRAKRLKKKQRAKKPKTHKLDDPENQNAIDDDDDDDDEDDEENPSSAEKNEHEEKTESEKDDEKETPENITDISKNYPGRSPTDAPGASPTDAPGASAADAPGASATDAPGASATDAPGASAPDAPGASPADAPGASPTDESSKNESLNICLKSNGKSHDNPESDAQTKEEQNISLEVSEELPKTKEVNDDETKKKVEV